MKDNFHDKVAFITGGTSGIGKACALAFAAQGANVVITGKNYHEASNIIQHIHTLGVRASFIATDIADPKQIESTINETINNYGRLDFAVNNAGIAGPAGLTIVDCSESIWDEIIQVNLKSIWVCMKYEIAHMIKQGSGSIINVASIAGLKAGRVNAAYTASKHGVVGLTKSAAIETAKLNIRINAICPAFIDTPMLHELNLVELAKEVVPLGRCGTDEEVAELIIWLASEKASFITGAAITIDGGLFA